MCQSRDKAHAQECKLILHCADNSGVTIFTISFIFCYNYSCRVFVQKNHRQTDRETERQTDRQTQTHTNTGSDVYSIAAFAKRQLYGRSSFFNQVNGRNF